MSYTHPRGKSCSSQHSRWHDDVSYTHPRGKSSYGRRTLAIFSFGLFVVLTSILGVGVTAHQTASNPVSLTITADGETRTLTTEAKTVADLLTEYQIELGKMDRCSVPLTTDLTDGMALTITRVRKEVVTERHPLPYKTREVLSREHRVGTRIVKSPGVEGEKVVTYVDYYKDDERTQRIKADVKITKPQPEVVVLGTRGMTLSSRHLFGNRRMLELEATAYGPGGNGKWGMTTAMGIRPRYGIVAVDPRLIPLGTRLYVEGYGEALAADTGGAIKGKRIDLFYPTDRQARAYGRKKVRVIILGKSED
ncbi:MAG: hypothetical protein OHK0029_28780 [Armatimonadaceae bacterium]